MIGLAEDPRELLRSRGEHEARREVPAGTDVRQVRRDPGVDRAAHDVFHGQRRPVHREGRAVADDELDRARELTPPEALPTLAGGEQRLVEVVMQDGAGALEIHAIERERRRLDERVAHAVRMTEPLALDEFRAPPGHRDVSERLEDELAHGSVAVNAGRLGPL